MSKRKSVSHPKQVAAKKKRIRKHMIADQSFHYLAFQLVTHTLFTAQGFEADYGYDVFVVTYDKSGLVENGLIFVQLKATDRLDIRGSNVRYRIKKQDVALWESEPFPVFLVVYDAKNGRAFWLYLQKYFRERSISAAKLSAQSVLVELPAAQVVSSATFPVWHTAKAAVMVQLGKVTHA